MANLVKLVTPETFTSCITTGLNSLADGSSATGSSALTNSTDLYLLMDVSILLASLTPGSGAYVEVHVLPLNQDGTHYSDISATTNVGSVSIASGTAAKYEVLTGIALSPRDFKIALVNHCGAALASSGNLVYYSRYNINNNG